MNHSLRLCLLSITFAGILLSACSPQTSAPLPSAAEQKAQADASAAARNIATYRQLLKLHDDEMVVAMGKDIVSRFPDSAAAKEVQQSLPAIEKRYTDTRDTKRLAALWTYQTSPMAGGTQSTATIFSSEPSGNDRVRLVLRRHTSWGQSAYLYGSKPGFVCHGNCTINGTSDGKPVRIKAFAPPTGEPALMIRDDKAFIALLRKTKKLNLDVTLADGEKKESLVYEVAGFNPDKWLPLPKAAKSKAGHK